MPPPPLAEDGLTILLFHGVVPNPDFGVRNYTRKHVGREAFARCLAAYKRKGTALSLEDVIACHRDGGRYPPRAFAVTFDDGYENNASVAAPILADLGIPATFFVTTGFIENNTMTWIDELEHCLDETPEGHVRLPWPGASRSFASPAEKIALLEDIRRLAKRDPALDIDAFVEDVFRQCHRPRPRQLADPLNQKLSWTQTAALAAHPLFRVGGHTHTHATMSFLDAAALEFEVRHCLDLLRTKAGVQAKLFSYPEGLAHCFDERVIQSLKAHGIACCPTAIPGVNRHGADLFRLRRQPVVL